MNYLSLLAQVLIVGTYFYLAQTGKRTPNLWANALGCVPILVVEGAAGLWNVVPLTAAFGLIGWYGLGKEWYAVRQQRV